jgi:hypothetical protein
MSDAPDLLPDLVDAVHRLVGADQARTVQEALGGARIYVPKHADKGHWLTDLVGADGMRKIVREFGGDLVLVNRQETKADLHRHLVQLLSLARIPVWIIALICDLSPRHVSSVRAQLRTSGELPPPAPGRPSGKRHA